MGVGAAVLLKGYKSCRGSHHVPLQRMEALAVEGRTTLKLLPRRLTGLQTVVQLVCCNAPCLWKGCEGTLAVVQTLVMHQGSWSSISVIYNKSTIQYQSKDRNANVISKSVRFDTVCGCCLLEQIAPLLASGSRYAINAQVEWPRSILDCRSTA